MSKVVLSKDSRSTRKVALPSSGVEVEVYPSLLIAELDDTDVSEAEKGNMDAIASMLVKIIVSWNAYASEEEAEPLPITKENVKLLHTVDLQFLTDEIKAFRNSEKKS